MQGELRNGRGLRMRNRPYLAYMLHVHVYTQLYNRKRTCMHDRIATLLNVKCATKLDFEV